MASIERTAYPRYQRVLTSADLRLHYTLTEDEHAWLLATTRGSSRLLGCAVLLKAVQHLGYFPALDALPQAIVQHLRAALDLDPTTTLSISPRTLYTYHRLIRERLGLITTGRLVRHIAAAAVYQAARVMDNPADLINVTIDTLIRQRAEVPAFSTLDRLVRRVRSLVNRQIFGQIMTRLSTDEQARLDTLLTTTVERSRTIFNALKLVAKRPSHHHLDEILAHLTWLESLGQFAPILDGVPPLKLQHFAAEAKALDAAELKDITLPKRLTLLVCLIHRMQTQTRDALVDMFCKRMATFHKQARHTLQRLQLAHQTQIDQVVTTFSAVLDVLDDAPPAGEAINRIQALLAPAGGVAAVRDSCEAIAAFTSNNHLPLVWTHYQSHRSLLFRMLDALTLASTSQETSLIAAVDYLKRLRQQKAKYLPATLDLSFASDQWRRLIQTRQNGKPILVRKHLEVCIFSYLAAELKSGDVAVAGSDSYADYRDQLLPWTDCAPQVADYCRTLGLPDTAATFVADLKDRLIQAAATFDRLFPDNDQVRITEQGEPVLKRVPQQEPSAAALALEARLLGRLPERHLIDILATVARWTGCTRHFGPLSGADPKLDDPFDAYVRLLFAYGTNMGPVQAARHMRGAISAHTLSYLNRRHADLTKLTLASADISNTYDRMTLAKLWGPGRSVAVDGTKHGLADNNPLAEYHFRYRDRGGIAYNYIADNYIAIFTQFIACGVWEAVYLIEGLLKNQTAIKPTKVHTDTQGQSTTVFALTALLGIELLPRIRNWKDLVLYKPDAGMTYQHTESLFGETIDWDLIERHWQDLMQVVLSIQAGKISSALLLRKLGNDSRKNRLYRVFREVGRVIRTLFLLRYLSDAPLREEITASTNRVEAFHGFAKWLFFGYDGSITDQDPEEAEKQIKYENIVANAVILHNAYDLTDQLKKLIDEGYPVTREDIAILSPYVTSNIKRFGDYVLNADAEAPSLEGTWTWEGPPGPQAVHESTADGMQSPR
jgi:TnpA family transposase